MSCVILSCDLLHHHMSCVILSCDLLRDMRQEVTVLAQLNHPNIVALLGVCFHPMFMVIELAPMGSLFGILDKKVEQCKEDQADRASLIPRMAGGMLGHEMSTRIALQVSRGCPRYMSGGGGGGGRRWYYMCVWM